MSTREAIDTRFQVLKTAPEKTPVPDALGEQSCGGQRFARSLLRLDASQYGDRMGRYVTAWEDLRRRLESLGHAADAESLHESAASLFVRVSYSHEHNAELSVSERKLLSVMRAELLDLCRATLGRVKYTERLAALRREAARDGITIQVTDADSPWKLAMWGLDPKTGRAIGGGR